jgi:peptidoglycan/LPS O-acetylase OafA/YrhL
VHADAKILTSKRLELLDSVRFLAVLMVMMFHYTFNGIVNGKVTSIGQESWVVDFTKYGYLGVELFFMISGYVIFFSAQYGSASKFAVSRAVRLFPAYWFAVLFTSFFAIGWGSGLMSVTPVMVLANLTMLQSFFGVSDVDGAYWTLAYEIRFYAAVFVVLLVGGQKHLRKIFMCWPILFCIALFLGQDHRTYAGGYYYYFCAGALFAVLKDRFDWRVVVTLLITFVLCITYSSGKAAELTLAKGSTYNGAVIGLIVSSFFFLFVLQNAKEIQQARISHSKLLGSLTYPIYLVHAHFGYILLNQFANDGNKFFAYPLVIIVVLAIAYFINSFFEVRLAVFWRDIFYSTLGRLTDAVQEKLRSFISLSLPR